jgi:DNA replication protein DnaC
VSAANVLPDVLGRLKLTAIRDRLDTLLDDAAGRELSLRETLALLCDAEVARREERRIQMGMSIAKFPFVRTLDGFDFEAQPSLDPKQVRDLTTCRGWPMAMRFWCLRYLASAKVPWPSAARRYGWATRCCSSRQLR